MAVQVRTPERKMAVWEPLREMENLERRFENMFRRPFFPSFRRWGPWEGTWMPAMDVIEKEDKFIVTAELPGIKADDIDISIVGSSLTIKGEKKTEKEHKEEAYYRSERSYGSFFRSIELPSDVDPNKIEANFDSGILEVTVPKTTEKAPSKIKVAVKKT